MNNLEPFPDFKVTNEKEICNYGTYLVTDSEGFLVSKANIKNISSKWMEMIKEIVAICKANIEKVNLVSIFVDGSVASGVQVDNVSDLDMLVVCKDTSRIGASNLSNIDSPWFVEQKEALYKKYPFTKRVHLTVWGYDDIQNIKSINKRFSLKTQAVVVYGKDLAKDIDKFKPDNYLAKELLKDLPQRVSNYIEDIKQAETEDKIKFTCFFTAKDIVRKGILLVMPREKRFTTSLYLSYSSFSKYYPTKSQNMYTMLYLAMNPTADKEKLLDFVKNFGEWFAQESDNVYK